MSSTRRPPTGGAGRVQPPRARLDPRIRARRIEVRRQQGRRRLRVLLALVLVAAVAGLGFAAANSALLDVDEVAVTGAARTPTGDVLQASGIQLGDPLLLMDVDGIADDVGRLPWVDTAAVHRSITGSVEIEVVERRAVAAVRVPAGAWVLVDDEGRQLQQVPEPGGDVLVLHGVDATGEVGTTVGPGPRSVLRLLDALTPPVREALSGIGLDGDELVLDLAAGGRVRLGDAADLDAKLVSLETMLARVDLRCLAELDLGVPSAPALTRTSLPASEGEPPLSDLSECP